MLSGPWGTRGKRTSSCGKFLPTWLPIGPGPPAPPSWAPARARTTRSAVLPEPRKALGTFAATPWDTSTRFVSGPKGLVDGKRKQTLRAAASSVKPPDAISSCVRDTMAAFEKTDAVPPGPRSLEGIHSTVEVPHHAAGFWRQWRAYTGPALLVSVGYMDPGNWGTDLAGGAQFKYGLLWVVALASLMAIVMQVTAARLGVVTGKDLAQCCRDWYPRWTRWPNWLLCEVAIGACDLAEVLGSAVALNLMFHIPLFWAVIITAADVLLLLALQGFGIRTVEAVVLVLVGTIGICYFLEIFVLPQTSPSFLEMGRSLLTPGLREAGMAYVAIGIIGATVMPHNLYLHSALVQSRKLQKDEYSIRSALRFNTLDSSVALTIAFFVNAAIMVLAAMVFYGKESVTVAGGQVIRFGAQADWIRVAYLTLAPLLGTPMASILFVIALLASGHSSTITGTH